MVHFNMLTIITMRAFSTIILIIIIDIGLKTQLQFMWLVARRKRYFWSYSFGPWKKILLMALCVGVVNVALIFPSIPDEIMMPCILISILVYLFYAKTLYKKEVD